MKPSTKSDFSQTYITDRTLWIAVFVLMAAGLVMVYSSSFIYAQEHYKDGLYFFKRHLVFMVLGLVAFVAGFRIHTKHLHQNAYWLLGGAALLLGLALVPGVGHRAGGASRWINLGFTTLQPAELAKVAVVIFVATQLQRKESQRSNWRTGFVTYFLSPLPIYVLLMLQPDFGTTALLLATTMLLLIATGIRLRYIFTALGVLTPTVLALILSTPYRRARVEAFLNPWTDASGKGFQIIQSLVAVYSGKWLGVGLGNSKEKLLYLPEAHNDFIFAVVSEELGVFGITFFVALFLIIVLRGLNASLKLETMFEKALTVGIATVLGLQAFFNMGVTLGLLPTKGLPLPLVSYGGTSLVVTLYLLGVLTQLSERSSRS